MVNEKILVDKVFWLKKDYKIIFWVATILDFNKSVLK